MLNYYSLMDSPSAQNEKLLLAVSRAGNLFQEGDEIGAFLGIADMDIHPLARNKVLGRSQPFIEGGFIPYDGRRLDRAGIIEFGNRTGLASIRAT